MKKEQDYFNEYVQRHQNGVTRSRSAVPIANSEHISYIIYVFFVDFEHVPVLKEFLIRLCECSGKLSQLKDDQCREINNPTPNN